MSEKTTTDTQVSIHITEYNITFYRVEIIACVRETKLFHFNAHG